MRLQNGKTNLMDDGRTISLTLARNGSSKAHFEKIAFNLS
jgi:hypothetical protein